jgi:GT2 family glycosyltransferase
LPEPSETEKTRKDRNCVCVVLLNWRTPEETCSCLRSTVEVRGLNEMVVLENGSGDDSWDRLFAELRSNMVHLESSEIEITDRKKRRIESFYHAAKDGGSIHVHLIRSETNLGFAGGCNLAMDFALRRGATDVVLLNNDARCDNETISALLQVACESDSAIVGASVYDESGQHVVFRGERWPHVMFGARRRRYDENDQGPMWQFAAAHGAGMLLRRHCIEAVRDKFGCVFDDRYFMYCEETDLCLRATGMGFKSAVALNAKVYHRGSASSGGSGNARSYYYLARNRIELARRWLPSGYLIAFHVYYLASRLMIVAMNIARGKSAVAGAILLGLRDGYLGRHGKWEHH